jgi:hypothetical protein
VVSDTKVGTYAEGVSEQNYEKNIWTKEGLSDGRVEKTAQRRASSFIHLYYQVEEDEIGGPRNANGGEEDRI